MLSLLVLVSLLGRARPQAAVPALAGTHRSGGTSGGAGRARAARLPSAFWEGILRDTLPQVPGRPGAGGGWDALWQRTVERAPYALLRATLPGLAAVPAEPPAASLRLPARRTSAALAPVHSSAVAPVHPSAVAVPVRAAVAPFVSGAAARGAPSARAPAPAVSRRTPAPRPGAPGSPDPGTTVCGDRPVVLVYQTHAEESFVPVLGPHAAPADAFSEEPSKSVVRVGDELASALCASGVSVVHLRTRFDMEGRIGAYVRSLQAERSALKRWPSLRVPLDVHRDMAPAAATTAMVDGLPTARVLVVVGTDATLPDPRWRRNAAWATRVYDALNAAYPGLPRSSAGRPYFADTGRLNQQISPAALLLEIGGERNTMAEELRGARLLGRTLAGLIQAGAYPG